MPTQEEKRVLEHIFPGVNVDNLVLPTDETYKYILYKLQNTEALNKFRETRNALLTQSDKYMMPDYPHLKDNYVQGFKDYRRALRDLPNTARPTLDADGNLIGVEWPTFPEFKEPDPPSE